MRPIQSLRFALLLLPLLLLAAAPAAADAAFTSFIQSTLWPQAKAAGIRRDVFDAAFAGISDPDPAVLQMAGNQPELNSTTSQYIFKVVNPTRIAQGQKMQAANAALLSAIGKRYGVDPRVVLAIWGIESNYGDDIGGMKVVRSLATLAYRGQRRDYGRQQLIAALRILQSGVVTPAGFTGSWAGALGHTQFIPTSYLAFAVDWTGDGKRDIWRTPADALASTANYLSKAGWQAGVPWGVEVKVPGGLDRSLIGRKTWKSFAEWQKLGLAPAQGGSFAAPEAKAFLMYPQGLAGPGFLVTRNFLAIMDYNQSHSYALAVSYLADRIGGGAAFVGPWPDGMVELSGAERVELQQRLIRAGFDTGGSDGRFGARTYEAILGFQKARGLKLDGMPSKALLGALRQES